MISVAARGTAAALDPYDRPVETLVERCDAYDDDAPSRLCAEVETKTAHPRRVQAS
jgi:hypothetical protein